MSSSDSTPAGETQPTPAPGAAETAPVPAAADTPPQAPVPPAAVPAPTAAPVAAPQAETMAWPAGAPAYAAVPAGAPPAPPKQRGAWIRALTPLTAGVLAALLVLAGFGIGVVVGWHHDGGRDQFGPAGFQRQMPDGQRMGPGMKGFGPGQGYGLRQRPGQPGRQGQQGQQPNLPSRPGQLPTPSPTASS